MINSEPSRWLNNSSRMWKIGWNWIFLVIATKLTTQIGSNYGASTTPWSVVGSLITCIVDESCRS